MSFWSLSQTGKDAQGQLGELPRWSRANMVQSLGRGNTAYDTATGYNSTLADYFKNRMQNGFGTPQDIRAWGQQAMPGVDTAMGNIRDAYGRVQTPQSTADQQNANINKTQNYNDNAFGQINQGTKDAYGNAINNTQGAYSSARKNGAAAYTDLIGKTGNAYADAQANLKRLLPGGDLLAANAAR